MRADVTEGAPPPFTEPHVASRQWDYVRDALDSGALDGNGPYTRTAVEAVRDVTGAPDVLLTPSCTAALEMSALLTDVGPGDEVIVPAFGYAPTAAAFALRGARLVFVDCRPDTLNIDEDLVDAAVTDRTRVIVVLHYAGVPCEMDTIGNIAANHGLDVVEDAAQAFGSSHRGRPIGGFGRFAALSFHATKNVHSAKGGALLVNDPVDRDRARTVQDRGTDRHLYFRGEVPEYSWVDLGSSYVLTEVLAALLAAQLEEFDEVQRRRHASWATYHAGLGGWSDEHGVARPVVPAHTQHSAHLYHLVLPTERARDGLLEHLASRGLTAAIHYMALHNSPAGRRYGRPGPGGCQVAADRPRRLIRLPMHAGMDPGHPERVIEAITEFRP